MELCETMANEPFYVTRERWTPWGFAVVSFAVVVFSGAVRHIPGNSAAGILSAIVSVTGVAVGFLATAQSILVSVDDRRFIQRLKLAGIHQRLSEFLHAAMMWSFWLTVLSLFAMLADFASLKEWPAWMLVLSGIWGGCAGGTVGAYWILWGVWKSVMEGLGQVRDENP